MPVAPLLTAFMMDSKSLGKKREYIFTRCRQLAHVVVTCATTDEEEWPASLVSKFGGVGDMRAIIKLLDMDRASMRYVADDDNDYLPIKNEKSWSPLLSLKK